jgi:transposase InsO family protein
MEQKLLKIYEETMYPSIDKFWKIIEKKNLNVSYKEANDFIEKQPIAQIFRVKRHRNGNITAFDPQERVQIDICVMDKFAKSNHGFKYILFFVDVFSRKGYGIPMKTKNIKDTSEALETFCENHFIPQVINCDNDSSFMGQDFQKVIERFNILMIENDVGNHRQLGVVDRFIETIKNKIYKYFQYYNTTNWIDALPSILKGYNSTPHSALGGIRPENAHLRPNEIRISQINMNKVIKSRNITNSESKFNVGDKVRKKVKVVIKNRSFNPSYSTEIFTIEKIDGNRIFLNGLMKPVSPDSLQLIPKDSIEGNETALNEAIKADKIRRALKREGIEFDDEHVKLEKRIK